MTIPARSLIQAGMVVAVKQMEDKRHARISLEEGRLYLHAMQNQSPPPFAARLQVRPFCSFICCSLVVSLE